MKIEKVFTGFMLILFAHGCQDGYIDDITPVSPGSDTEDPEVVIRFPKSSTVIEYVVQDTTVGIDFEATDDIELASVTILFDGVEIASINEFLDYRALKTIHFHDNVVEGDYTVEVRAVDMAGKSASASVSFGVIQGGAGAPEFEEILYLPFDGDFEDPFFDNVITVEGSPGFAGEAKDGDDAYAGAADSYLTVPSDAFENEEFSAAFWMKINADPDRAGILVISPEDPDNPDAQNVRTSGFRFFREAAGTNQIVKLNVGTGESETWFDGGANAQVDPSTGEWVHFAFTISATEGKIYINGTVASENTLDAPIDWTGCDFITIMSGAPRFTGWNHWSDLSYMDELRIFDRALTEAEVNEIIASDSSK